MFGMVNVELCRLQLAVIPTQNLLKQEVTWGSLVLSIHHTTQPVSATATPTTIKETTIGGKGERMEINWNSVVYS